MENSSPVVFRLSPLQRAIWSNPDLRGGNVYGQVLMNGELDLDRLRDCFEKTAERHESLRTYFQLSSGFTFPFQVVREKPNFSWETFDLTTSNEAVDAELSKLTAHDTWPTATPFEGPTFGVKVIKTSVDRYVLALRALALCCDHVSLGNLISEAAHLYRSETVEESVQYADFSEWHNEALLTATEDSEAAKVFWDASPPVQLLPLVIRKSSSPDTSIRSHRFAIDPSTLKSAGGDLAPFLLTCWESVLSRLTNQPFATVDILNNGRPLEDLQLSIGLFARFFPVSVTLDDEPSFGSVLERTTEALANVDRWQTYSPAETNGSVSFEFIDLPAEIAADSVSFAITELEPLRWPFKLMLSCRKTGESVALELLYDAMRYESGDVARIAGYFERVVRAAATDASAKVSSFELLDDAERKQVVEGFNSDTATYSDSRVFHQLFEEQASLTPDRTALIFEKNQLTYAQLNAQSNQIASWLRKAGVVADTPVGLCMERSAEMIVALLGIVKAGGAYTPLLPDLPAGRLEHQIAETGLQIIVSTEALLEKLAGFGGRVLCLDRDQAQLETEPSGNLPQTVTGKNLMYILYTSGSTGTPKGVEVRHENVTNYIYGITKRLGLTELSTDAGLTFATVSTLGADLGNTSIFPPLVTGGCLAVIGYESAVDGGQFAERNREHPIDVLKITPSNLKALLASEAPENVLPAKFLIVGGEACTWSLVQEVRAAGKCEMLNHYGPTEATIGCLTYRIPAEPIAAAGTVPLGRPIPNMQVYVLDGHRRPVPVGTPGEICISGAGITSGYIGKPSETADKFVSHPFLPNGSALYRSGDLGRFLPDGNIEFLGRVDDQVKIRGYRVELKEIEARLNFYPGVQQTVVLLSQDETGDYLCAYVMTAGELSSGDAQNHLRQHLPEYMVPREFVVIEQFPLNANGKVDRRKLSELKSDTVSVLSEAVAPRNELEEQLVTIWKDTLRCERVGIYDNFFDLGGHSLLATQIISRIRSALGLNVSIRMLFEAPTVESLAQAIETTRVPQNDDSEIGDLLAELEGLSDSEAEEILGDYSPTSGGKGKGF